MTRQDEQRLARLRRIQENIAVMIGVVIALMLSLYFFTYAMLVDRGLTELLWAQAISAVIMVVVLFRLQQVAFFLLRLWFGRKREYRQLLRGLTLADLRAS